MTKDTKKQYSSKTIINTGVVSGYTILNHNSDSRIDREYTKSELQNLLALSSAYETTEELAVRLLAQYLLQGDYNLDWINTDNYEDLTLIITRELKSEIDLSDFESACASIRQLLKDSKDSQTKKLIYSKNTFFGIEQLKTIKRSLKVSSDLLEFSYTTEDPAICQKTLSLLTEIFIEKHLNLKQGQSKDVLGYFEEATNKSATQLKEAEDKLLAFRINNNIINYYEQTRFIADKKEDLDEFLFKEKMTLQAALASKEKLDAQLENRGLLSELNNMLLVKRNELTHVTKNLASLELISLEKDVDNKTIQLLKNKKDQLLSDMTGLTSQSQKLNYTQEGISSKELLSKWLNALIDVEESSSRIEVIKMRKSEFGEIYAKFAPWGSQLKKIEREIALAEEAYLENLHSYNQARLHLQNTLMSANLKIVEAPIYPVKPEKSKKLLLIALAFITGFILPLSIIILLDFLDNTFKNPIEACDRNGLSLAGAFPAIVPKNSFTLGSGKIDYLELREKAINQIYRNILGSKPLKSQKPLFIGLSSMRKKEGVSYLAKHLARKIELYTDVCIISSGLKRSSLKYKSLDLEFEFNILSKSKEEIIQIIRSKSEDNKGPEVFIFELPSLLEGTALEPDWTLFDEHLIVCRSNRVWSKADQIALDNISTNTQITPRILVNGVDPYRMEDFIGEVPKRRSFWRKRLKSLFMLNFSKTDIFQHG